MKKIRITAVLLILVMALAFVVLSSCGTPSSSGSLSGGGSSAAPIPEGYRLAVDEAVELQMPETNIDPQSVYAKLTYTAPMFYGKYRLLGGDAAVEKMAAEMNYFQYNDGGYEKSVAKLPHQIEAGPNNLSHKLTYIEGHEIMRLIFSTKLDDGSYSMTFLYGSYVIEGNKLNVTLFDHWNIDDNAGTITYELSDVVLSYDFKFDGQALTLTNDGKSVTLNSCLAVYEDDPYYHSDCYITSGSEKLDGMEQIEFLYSDGGKYSRLYADRIDGERTIYASGLIEKNGRFTMTIPWEAGTKVYQYIAFYCDNDGLVLTDGTNTYYYNTDYTTYYRGELNKYVSEDEAAKLEEMTEVEIENVAEKKEDLTEDLILAFKNAGINVTVNRETGEMAMDASVLFGGDSAEITADGKALLDKFIAAYTSIIYNTKYDGFISKTMVEGHIAPITGATYESGLPLSQQRADNVKNYCVGVDTGKLSQSLEAVGLSQSRPIYSADGNVNLDACRRVSFRFVINLDA